jgi:subtilase family serine protease
LRVCSPKRRIATVAVGVALGASAALSVPWLASAAGAAGSTLAPEPVAAPVPVQGGLGAVPPGASLVGPAPTGKTLHLDVTLQPRDPAALTAAVNAVSDPASPDYRHFLSPRQVAARYGPTPATIAAVVGLLKSDGLTVGQVAATGLSIPVSGKVERVESALSTQVSTYRLASGRTGYDANSRPRLPPDIASSVEGVLGLNTLNPPQPADLRGPPPSPASEGSKTSTPSPPSGLAPGQPWPQVTSCASKISVLESSDHALDSVDLADAYSFGGVYKPGAPVDYGAGATIALLELYGSGYSGTDIGNFASCYGITLGNGQISSRAMNGGGAVIGDGADESELDIETALELAPQADIKVYEGGPSDSIYSVLSQIVSDDTAKIVSVSWTNGCEAYVGQSEQRSEATLLQSAGLEGQSVFVASGDQGSEGCNVNRETGAPTGTGPVGQTVDPSTGTLYVANQSANTVSVDSEGSTAAPNGFVAAASVPTASGPTRVALDSTDSKVFVADTSANELTVFGTSSCNASSTSGCHTTTTIGNSGNHLSAPGFMAVNGSTLYVVNTASGTVAVYNASSDAYVASVSLPQPSFATAIAVDPAKGFVYVTDSGNARVDYFSAKTCNASTTTGCPATPATIPLDSNNPASLAVDDAAGALYVGNAGNGGGVTVISLSAKTVITTVSTAYAYAANGSALVQSVALSPSGNQVLAVLNGINFPGDLLATIDPGSESITATTSLESGTDTVGSLVTDGVRNYAWVIDSGPGHDVDIVENLNLAVTDPASQPGVTSVGGTTLESPLGPPPTEKTWNDQLAFAQGATGGGLSTTFGLPPYQAELLGGTGSGEGQCTGGACREVPDVAADADPNTGYIVYITPDNAGGWIEFGGTSAAAPLWAAVLADVSAADGTTSGYGNLDDALYALAGTGSTYFNDVKSGNNDYYGTNSGQYPSETGYDMTTGLGTPITSALAAGLTRIPLDVAVSGSQTYQGTPTFAGTPDYGGTGGSPLGVTVNTGGLTCTTVNGSTPVSANLAAGSDTLVPSSCSGATLSGANKADYVIVYTAATGDFVVNPAPINLLVSGTQNYGGTPTFTGVDTPPAGLTVNTSGLVCGQVSNGVISPTLAAGSYTIVPTTCQGATVSGSGASNYAVAYGATNGDFTVAPVSLTITASSQTMPFGSQPQAVSPSYQGFVNGDGPANLTGTLACSAGATSSSPPGTYLSSCSGVSDPNYVIHYAPGTTTVTLGTLDVAVSGSQTYSSNTPPTFLGQYAQTPGVTVDTSGLTCTGLNGGVTIGSSLPAGSYTLDPSTCSGVTLGGANAGYYGPPVLTSAPGDFVVDPAPILVTVSGGQTYGGTPSFSANVNTGTLPQGITVNGAAVICGDVGVSTPIGPTLPVASDTILGSSCRGVTFSGPGSSNYAPEYNGVPGGFTIVPALLTITASSQTTPFGVVPQVTPTFSGFVNGEGPVVLAGTLSCASGTVTTTPPGMYASGCSGVSDPNYAITFAGGTTSVVKATPVLTVSGSQTWDGSPTFSANVSPPLVAGTQLSTASLVCTTVTPSVPITPTLAVGTYTLVATSCSGATVTGTYSADYLAPTYSAPASDFAVLGGPHGYWLVGSDGGIFTFGSAQFYGSTGSLVLQRPVVGMTPTADKKGYWLVASDGGVFSFGDAGFYGSIPGLGLNPAGSGLPHSLNAPVVGIVPTSDGRGYFLVASDGGVFAFGDARFEGSCPGIGGCLGPVVSVVPDATGNGYWVVTRNGDVYTFGDAAYLGGAAPSNAPVTSAVRTWDGRGYWILRGDGTVSAFGDAVGRGGPTGSVGGLNPATAIFTDSDSGGYWVADALGAVFNFGDAPALGSMSGIHLNGPIIGASGF